MSKKETLLQWCRYMNVFSKVDIENWAIKNYYISAERRVREFAENPDIPIRRIPDIEATLRGLRKKGQAKVAWYEAE